MLYWPDSNRRFLTKTIIQITGTWFHFYVQIERNSWLSLIAAAQIFHRSVASFIQLVHGAVNQNHPWTCEFKQQSFYFFVSFPFPIFTNRFVGNAVYAMAKMVSTSNTKKQKILKQEKPRIGNQAKIIDTMSNGCGSYSAFWDRIASKWFRQYPLIIISFIC